MGRRMKVVSEALDLLAQASESHRVWSQAAAKLPDDERRALYREWFADAWRQHDAGRYVPSYPDYLRGLTCGAIKKDGKPCRMTTLGASGRCKFHGGASTGPRTTEGRAKALENLKLGRLKRGKS